MKIMEAVVEDTLYCHWTLYFARLKSIIFPWEKQRSKYIFIYFYIWYILYTCHICVCIHMYVCVSIYEWITRKNTYSLCGICMWYEREYVWVRKRELKTIISIHQTRDKRKLMFKTHFIKVLYPIYISSSANFTGKFFPETLYWRGPLQNSE